MRRAAIGHLESKIENPLEVGSQFEPGQSGSVLTVSRTPEGPGLGLPRKEVIQPQVPLRLPCYDLVPVTRFTVGASVPCGFVRRLRVLPASVA